MKINLSSIVRRSFFDRLRDGRTLVCLVLLFSCTIAFFWKIILTNQYTLFAMQDNALQFYPWSQYISLAIKGGSFPLWDPYTFGGHTFIGEMQQGVFYPLNLLMALWPGNTRGLLPVSVIEGFLILAHFLAACFMFALARRLGLSRFGAVVSGLCFSLGGILGRMTVAYANQLHSAIWLPLIFLALINATTASSMRRIVHWAMLAGIFLGFTVLAGHHVFFLYSIVSLVIYSVFLIFVPEKQSENAGTFPRALKIIPILTLILIVGMATAAVQILPTLEYSPHAIRWIPQPVDAAKKVSYETAGYDFMHPKDFMAFLFPSLFSGETHLTPYFGVLSLLLAMFSLLQLRASYYVKFFFFLMLAVLIYSLGHFSLLHGLSYVFIPHLDKAREATRSLHLVHFSMAVLAGFGSDALIRARRKAESQSRLWFLKLVVFFAAFSFLLIWGGYILKIVVYSKTGGPNDDYMFFSLFLLMASAFVFFGRHRHLLSRRGIKFTVLAVLLLDFSFFNTWGILPKSKYDGINNLYPERLYELNDTIEFLTSRPGHFRVDIREDALPHAIGQIHRLQTTFGTGASAYKDYWDFIWKDYSPKGRPLSLLNVEYIVSKSPLPDFELVKDGGVKVYRNPNCLPRAWIVHKIEKAAGVPEMSDRILSPSFDPKRTAVMARIPEGFASSEFGSADDLCQIVEYAPTTVVIKARTTLPGILVLSEIDYPGWQAYVDGKGVDTYRVNGILRGVFIEPGEHEVTFRYLPKSVRVGLILAMLTLIFFMVSLRVFAS
jgi:hypothetical protein